MTSATTSAPPSATSDSADDSATDLVAAERQRIDVAKVRAAGRIEVRDAEREARANARRVAREKRSGYRVARGQRYGVAVTKLSALIGVNLLAVAGQTFFFHGVHLPWPFATFVAAVVESVALFLNAHAHMATLAGDAAGRLRLFSYLAGAGVGALNASHWLHAPNGVAFSVIFGGASTLSPFLWGIHSRRENRDKLHAMGLVDRRTAKFSVSRWVWFPWRTLAAHRWAVWHGEVDPARAIALSGVAGPKAKRGGASSVADVPDAGPGPVEAQGKREEVSADADGQREETSAPSSDVALVSDTTNAQSELDGATLMLDTPPSWEGLTQRAAVQRADALLPGRNPRQLALALATVGVTVSQSYIRGIRSSATRDARSATPSATGEGKREANGNVREFPRAAGVDK